MSSPRRAKKSGIFKTIFILIVLSAAGYGLYSYFLKSKTPEEDSLITAKVKRADIENVVTASGMLEPSEYVDLGAQISGTLEKIYFQIGDTVKKGDLMAQIDPAIFTSRLQQDEANLENLKAQLVSREASFKLAKQKQDRNQGLLRSNAVSEQVAQESEAEYSQAKANLDALKAQIKQAEATLDGSRTNLGYTKIYAPMDGTVVNIIAREGQTLNANQTTPNLMRLANLEIMTVQAKVSEADITRVKPGLEAYFTTLGNLDKKYVGTVTQIRPTPDATNAPVFYNVLFNVKNPDRDLMPQMTAQVFFVLSHTEDSLTMPLTALEYAQSKNSSNSEATPRGEKSQREPETQRGERTRQVYKLQNGEPIQVNIQTGISNRLTVEILSGLSEGDEVVVGPIKKESRGIRPRITWR